MEASVTRLHGEVKQSGNPAIAQSICEGMSRAEMQAKINSLMADNRMLRARLDQTEKALRMERRARQSADIECRAKTGALLELRRGMYGRWSQLLQMTSKEHKAWDRFITIVAACTALGAIAILCMAIIVAVG